MPKQTPIQLARKITLARELGNLGTKMSAVADLYEERGHDRALKLVYEWTRTGHLSLREFTVVVSKIAEAEEGQWPK